MVAASDVRDGLVNISRAGVARANFDDRISDQGFVGSLPAAQIDVVGSPIDPVHDHHSSLPCQRIDRMSSSQHTTFIVVKLVGLDLNRRKSRLFSIYAGYRRRRSFPRPGALEEMRRRAALECRHGRQYNGRWRRHPHWRPLRGAAKSYGSCEP